VPEDDKYEASCGSFSLLTGKTTSTHENAVRVRAGLKDLFEVLHRTAKIEEDFLVHRRDAWISAWVLSQVNGIRGTHATLATPRLVSPHEVSMFGRTYIVPETMEEGATLVALNVGGALIPILVSIYLLLRTRMYGRMLIGVALVAAVVHSLAHIVPGIGIAVPMIAPPLVAAAVGLVLSFRGAPPIAYVAGSMGTLIGPDLLNLRAVAHLGAPIVSIGGAGTFDGVFLTGIIA